MIAKNCKTCNKSFKVGKFYKYCSLPCKKIRTLSKECIVCSKQFFFKSGGKQPCFCSKECQLELERSLSVKNVKKCKNCNIEFETRYDAMFCAKSCSNAYRRLNPTGEVKGFCLFCNSRFVANRGNAKYCSSRCRAASYYHLRKYGKVDKKHKYDKTLKISNPKSGSDVFGQRWELLWNRYPQLHKAMLKIESEIPLNG